jgi:hypothetical protein
MTEASMQERIMIVNLIWCSICFYFKYRPYDDFAGRQRIENEALKLKTLSEFSQWFFSQKTTAG